MHNETFEQVIEKRLRKQRIMNNETFEQVIGKRLRKQSSKTMVSLANTNQALRNPSEQMTIFFVSLRPSWKASIGENMQ